MTVIDLRVEWIAKPSLGMNLTFSAKPIHSRAHCQISLLMTFERPITQRFSNTLRNSRQANVLQTAQRFLMLGQLVIHRVSVLRWFR